MALDTTTALLDGDAQPLRLVLGGHRRREEDFPELGADLQNRQRGVVVSMRTRQERNGGAHTSTNSSKSTAGWRAKPASSKT